MCKSRRCTQQWLPGAGLAMKERRAHKWDRDLSRSFLRSRLHSDASCSVGSKVARMPAPATSARPAHGRAHASQLSQRRRAGRHNTVTGCARRRIYPLVVERRGLQVGNHAGHGVLWLTREKGLCRTRCRTLCTSQ